MTSIDVIAGEYRAATEGCALVDRSDRGKLALTGADAKSFLQGQVSNDVEGLTPGSGCYAAFLTPKGKMLGDLRVLDAEDELLLDTERVALQGLFNMIRRFSIGYDVELHKRTLERGLLSLIGPETATVLGGGVFGLSEHTHSVIAIGGREARAIRTDVGVDLLCDAADTPVLAGALQEAGATSVSVDVAEIVRVEHGRPRYGLDLDDTVIPQEAGLNERAVSFTKGCYVGQETVARLYYRGKPNRHLRGLACSSPVQTGDELASDGRPVGRVGSAVVSPRLGALGLAIVRREVPVGAGVTVGEDEIAATVVELPFG